MRRVAFRPLLRAVRWLGPSKLRPAARVVLSVVAADLATKLAALAVFRAGEVWELGAGVLVGLTFNALNLGTRDRAFAATWGANALLFTGVAGVLVAFALGRWLPRRAPPLLSIAVVGALVGLGTTAALAASSAFPVQLLPHEATLAVRAVGSLAFLVTLLRLVQEPQLVYGVALLLAGNTGNALSYVWSPRGVPDIVHVRSLSWLYQMFNVADAAIAVGSALLLTFPLVRSARRMWHAYWAEEEPEDASEV